MSIVRISINVDKRTMDDLILLKTYHNKYDAEMAVVKEYDREGNLIFQSSYE